MKNVIWRWVRLAKTMIWSKVNFTNRDLANLKLSIDNTVLFRPSLAKSWLQLPAVQDHLSQPSQFCATLCQPTLSLFICSAPIYYTNFNNWLITQDRIMIDAEVCFLFPSVTKILSFRHFVCPYLSLSIRQLTLIALVDTAFIMNINVSNVDWFR